MLSVLDNMKGCFKGKEHNEEKSHVVSFVPTSPPSPYKRANVCFAMFTSLKSTSQMDKKGELTGDDIAFIYPDMRMALKVKWWDIKGAIQ